MTVGVAPEQGVAVLDMRRRRAVLLDPGGEERTSATLAGFPMAADFEPAAAALVVAATDFRSAPRVER